MRVITVIFLRDVKYSTPRSVLQTIEIKGMIAYLSFGEG
jgi:hypothetical protein